MRAELVVDERDVRRPDGELARSGLTCRSAKVAIEDLIAEGIGPSPVA
jgi:hypothetical protein